MNPTIYSSLKKIIRTTKNEWDCLTEETTPNKKVCVYYLIIHKNWNRSLYSKKISKYANKTISGRIQIGQRF